MAIGWRDRGDELVVLGGALLGGRAATSFDPFSFSFRVSAGVFFGVLFVTRGFGIAAGTHALYDIIVSLG